MNDWESTEMFQIQLWKQYEVTFQFFCSVQGLKSWHNTGFDTLFDHYSISIPDGTLTTPSNITAKVIIKKGYQPVCIGTILGQIGK